MSSPMHSLTDEDQSRLYSHNELVNIMRNIVADMLQKTENSIRQDEIEDEAGTYGFMLRQLEEGLKQCEIRIKPGTDRSYRGTSSRTITALPTDAGGQDGGATPPRLAQLGFPDGFCDVPEETSKPPGVLPTNAAEFVRGIANMTISTADKFLELLSHANTIYYSLPHLGGDHTAVYALEIGVTSSQLDVYPADDVADKDGEYSRLVTDADDEEPGCGNLKPLPGIVYNVGSLAVYRPKHGYITTAFGLVVDVMSASKDIWLVHDGACNDECEAQCDKICADFLSETECGDDTGDPRGARADSHTPLELICDEHRDLLITADKIPSGSSACGGHLHTEPPRFDIAWLDQPWAELPSPCESADRRRTRIAKGIARSARRVGARLQATSTMEIHSMSAGPK